MTNKITINLAGPNGNAYYLMGYAAKLAKQMGLDANEIVTDMKSNDYTHLIAVFEKHFGKVINLVK